MVGCPWLIVKVIDFKPLALLLYHCGFKSSLGLRVLSCEEAIQLAYGMSVVPFNCGLLPPEKLEKIPMTYTVLVRCKIQHKMLCEKSDAICSTISLLCLKYRTRHVHIHCLKEV
jgi:hypothetical protein